MIITADKVNEIGKLLRDARHAQGKSLMDIEAATGIAKQTISQLENCATAPRLATLVILAKELGLEIEIRENNA